MNSIEILGNCSGSADKSRKLYYSEEFCINLCLIHSYDLFAKYRNLTKNTVSWKMVVESLQFKVLAQTFRPPLKKREKIL